MVAVEFSDEELLGRMMNGDEESFTALYRRRQAGVYRFALQMSGSAEIAEDVTQEVFLTLIREAGRYESGRGSLAAFLYGVARNHLLRSREKNRSLVGLADEENVKDEALLVENNLLAELVQSERLQQLRQAILALPTHYREAVVLCDLHELSYAEAAQVLDCAIGTVRSRLHRARSLLIEKMRGTGRADEAAPEVNSVRCLV